MLRPVPEPPIPVFDDSRELFLRLVELSPIPMAVCNKDGLIYVNQAIVRLLGATAPSDLLGKPISEYVHPTYRPLAMQRLERVLSEKDIQLLTQRLQRSDGQDIEAEVAAIPITYKGETAAHLVVYQTYSRLSVHQALRESQERLHAISEHAADVIYIRDRDGYYLMINPAGASLAGLEVADFLGRQDEDIFPAEHAQLTRETDQRVMTTGQPLSYDFTLEVGGVERIFSTIKFPYVSAEGDIIGVAGIVHDITKRKRVEEAEREQRLFAEALSDSAAAINSTLDLDEVLDRILDNARRVVPHDAAGIVLKEEGGFRVARYRRRRKVAKQSGAITCLGIAADKLPELFESVKNKRSLIITDTSSHPGWIKLGGRSRFRSYIGTPICIADEVIGYLNLASKMPHYFEKKHAKRLQAFANQAAIAIQNARLYEAVRRHAADLEDRYKELDSFGYSVAHDLKSPLHVVMGYSNLLRTDFADQMSQDVRMYLENIEIYAHKMHTLIQGLLTLARIRSADETITQVDVTHIVQSVLDQFKERIKARNVTVHLVPDELPPVMGYGPWIEQVFTNLLDNAIKYSDPLNNNPHVTIRGIRQGDRVRYEVEDDGIGIKPEHLPTLFDIFTRFTRGQRVEGAGIGLSIVHRIITKLKGQVGVESKPGEGSTFWFVLPAPPEPKQPSLDVPTTDKPKPERKRPGCQPKS